MRTPLNSILGFSDLLAEQTASPLTPKQGRFVEHIRRVPVTY
jgi:signal transduction histidine kinase